MVRQKQYSTEHDEAQGDANLIGMRDIAGFLRRNWRVVGASIMGAVLIAIAYLLVAEPVFTATARIVIDPEQARIASQDAVSGTIVIETGEVESQVEIIRSEAIAKSVIEQLSLTEDAELQDGGGVISRLAFWRPHDDKVVDPEFVMRKTVAGFLERLRVWRVGQSYVLDVAYNSTDPIKAAAVANATALAYIKAGLDAKSSAAKSGAGWLESRLAEISGQANASARAVEDFRNRNQISQAGTTSLDEQQLTEANIQLSRAKADTAAERAKLAMINKFLQSETYVDGYVDEALRNPQITALRERLNTASTQFDELKGRYGENGAAVLAAQQEIDRLKGEVRQELVRIGQVYKSNVEAAERREQYVNDQLQATIQSGLSKGMARVQLGELESRANTYRQMYQSLMQQLISALQQESFPVGDSRMVSAAATPLGKTWPKGSLVIALAVVLGGLAGLGYSAIREVSDRRIKTENRLRRELGLSSLGALPFVSARAISKAAPQDQYQLLNFVLDHPNHLFSDAVRNTKASLDLIMRRQGAKVVGITSALPGEGKTTVASNLAQLYAATGSRTMLIDTCAANPTLTRLFTTVTRSCEAIESDVVVEQKRRIDLADNPGPLKAQTVRKLNDGRIKEPYPSVSVITPPALMGVDELTHNSSQEYRYLNLQALESHLDRLRDQHDIIILDLPDLTTTADARIVSVIVDCVILTVGDRQNVTLDVLAAAIASCSGVNSEAMGVVFNTPRPPRTTAPRASIPPAGRMDISRIGSGGRFSGFANSLKSFRWSKA
ncbi:exopolysaccharide transport family protein [Phyllobacterium sp. SB3]|uniref:GumC family protein n=1 Tax=Phyllobacterium sp. SB3 TaxID=3156073 RepID=UPI0032AEBE7C